MSSTRSNQANRIADVSDALQKIRACIVGNEVTGNPFQPNVEFRGFVASPVSGTPQGLRSTQTASASRSVRDTVNWD